MRTSRAIAIISTTMLVSSLLWASPASGQDRTLTVTPAADLDGGQMVEVSGTGWTPNVGVGFCLAAEGAPGEEITQDLCGRPTGTVTTDGLGNFVGQLWIDRLIHIPLRDAWIDCTDPADGGCGIGGGEIDDLLGTVTIPDPQITFAVPPSPPATLGAISYTPEIGVVPGGEITVTGSGFRPDAVVDLYQCLPGTAHPSTCGPAPQSTQRIVADANGGFVAPLVIDRFVDPPGAAPATDCTVSACSIVAAEAVDFVGTAVELGLQFPVKIVPGIASVSEGNSGSTALEIPVTLSAPATEEITVEWDTVFFDQGSPVEADPASDYVADSGVVTFGVGVTDAVVPISVNGDVVFEPDELFVVSFHDPTNAVIGGFYGLGFGVIVNDDPETVVVPGTIEVVEGDAGPQSVEVPVSLTSASTRDITVEWNTVELAGTPLAAEEGVDYDAASGTVTFPAGSTEPAVPVTVTINGDTAPETDELVVVSFHDPVGAPVGGFFGLGFVAILDDDSSDPEP